jgi:hypothetical protein
MKKAVMLFISSACLFFILIATQGCRQNAALKRAQTAMDILEVEQLHYRYVDDLTFRNWDDLFGLFSDNATLDVFVGQTPVHGRSAIEQILKDHVVNSPRHSGREANMVVHPIVMVNGDTAKSNSIIYFITGYDGDTGKPQSELHLMQGIYNCEYVKENGSWKISMLKWTPRVSLPPLPEAAAPQKNSPPAKAGK